MHGPGESSRDSGGWRSAVSAARSVGRGSARAGNGAKRAVRRLTRAGGAGRTGLANLIELTAASSVGDAFVAVALAGTLFFSASVDQARGRVALALLITIAPFAVLAPFIGPLLDRVQQGRRFILAGTLLARGLLCWGMAGAVSHNDALTLLPAAFGVLVLQKAFGVTRSAIAPRLLPAEITLVTANARSSLASLIASTAGAGLAAGLAVLLGGGQAGAGWVLRIGTLIYLAAMVLAFRLPDGVDTPLSEQVTVVFKRGPQGPEPVPAAGRQPGGQLPARADRGRGSWRHPAAARAAEPVAVPGPRTGGRARRWAPTRRCARSPAS